MSDFIKSKATPASYRLACENYRALVLKQRKMPAHLQYTMADELRHAKAVCSVEAEELKNGIR